MPLAFDPPTTEMLALAQAVNAELSGAAKVSFFARTEADDRRTYCVLIQAGTRRWTRESGAPLDVSDKDEIVAIVRDLLDRPVSVASKYQPFEF